MWLSWTSETLERWRQVSVDVAGRQMDWDRMRGMISNHLRFAGLPGGRDAGRRSSIRSRNCWMRQSRT